MKKAVSLILAVLMLAALFVPVSAAGAEREVISNQVLNSITEEDTTGLGLAFRYTMAMSNVTVRGARTFTGATVTIDGVEYNVVKMGAVVTNHADAGNAESMVLENVTGIKMMDVEAKRLWDWDDTSCSFAVRITQVPTNYRKAQIYARPYYVYEKNGEEVAVYGNVANKSYFSGWCDANPIELPAIGTDIDVAKKKDRIRVSDATETLTEDGQRKVTLTFRNYTTNWITEETDYVQYTVYDAAGKALESNKTLYIGCIDTKKNKIKSFSFIVPDNAAQVKLTGSKIVYWTEWS